jgi:hypothetical protein
MEGTMRGATVLGDFAQIRFVWTRETPRAIFVNVFPAMQFLYYNFEGAQGAVG